MIVTLAYKVPPLQIALVLRQYAVVQSLTGNGIAIKLPQYVILLRAFLVFPHRAALNRRKYHYDPIGRSIVSNHRQRF